MLFYVLVGSKIGGFQHAQRLAAGDHSGVEKISFADPKKAPNIVKNKMRIGATTQKQ